MVRYEYATLILVRSTNFADIRHEHPMPPQTWTDTFSLYLPGAEPVEMDGQRRFDDVAGELGADGWRLVTESIQMATIVNQMYGWLDVSSPVGIVWKFIREVPS